MIIAAFLAITLDPALRLLFTHLAHLRLPAALARPRRQRRARSARSTPRRGTPSAAPDALYEPVCRWSLRHGKLVIARRPRARARHRPGLPTARVRVHAAPRRGRAPLHALHHARASPSPRRRGSCRSGPDPQGLPRSRARPRQGRAGRDLHRPGAPLDVGDRRSSLKPQVRVAPEWTPGSPAWAPGWLAAGPPPHHPGPHLHRAARREMNEALQLPGVSNAWTMPIKGRIDMLTTGIRTPVGSRSPARTSKQIERIGTQIEASCRRSAAPAASSPNAPAAATSSTSIWKRDALARYGLSHRRCADGASSPPSAARTSPLPFEGRERYPVNVRYLRDFRSDLDALGRASSSPSAGGQRQVPLAQLADRPRRHGPVDDPRRERAAHRLRLRRPGRTRPGSYVEEAERAPPGEARRCPPGYAVAWSGQYEAHAARARSDSPVVVPLTLLLILLLLYLNTRSFVKTLIVAARRPLLRRRRHLAALRRSATT